MKNNVKLQMKAINENVTVARGVIASFLVDVDITVNSLNEIKTIVSEAITNAIVHGYQGDINKTVKLEFDLNENVLTMIIEDEGIGISDIEQAKEPLFTTKLQEERAGLGFTIMEIFSDYLEIKSTVGQGTKIICKKILNGNKK